MSLALRFVGALSVLATAGAAAAAAPASAADLPVFPAERGDWYLSLAGGTSLPKLGGGSLTVADEDVVYYHAEEEEYELVFDGSDVGLSGATIDAIAMMGSSNQASGLALSLTSARTLRGVSGTVDDSDVVRFLPTSLGTTTAGSFTILVDGSTFGLTSDGEDVDAFAEIDDVYYFSTTGNFSINTASGGVSGQDEDVFWCMYDECTSGGGIDKNFTASGLSADSEDVDALAVVGGGFRDNFYFSTTGGLSAGRLTAANEDVVACNERAVGDRVANCIGEDVRFTKYFDGNQHGIDGNVTAIEYPFPPGTE